MEKENKNISTSNKVEEQKVLGKTKEIKFLNKLYDRRTLLCLSQ